MTPEIVPMPSLGISTHTGTDTAAAQRFLLPPAGAPSSLPSCHEARTWWVIAPSNQATAYRPMRLPETVGFGRSGAHRKAAILKGLQMALMVRQVRGLSPGGPPAPEAPGLAQPPVPPSPTTDVRPMWKPASLQN